MTAGETATTVTNLNNLVKDVKIAEELISETICEETNLDVWRDVEGFEGRYEVSFLGHLRFADKSDKRLVSCTKYGDYLRANLKHKGDDKSLKNIAVHILVAKAFIPNPGGYTFVKHINGRLTDNRADNLEWVEFKPKKKRKSKRTSKTVSASPRLEVSEVEVIDGELWKDVMGFEGLYKISTNGRLVSILHKKPRYIRARRVRQVLKYWLRDKDGKKHRKAVRLLVAEHFVPNPLGYKYVMHIDGNPQNNNVDNLRWTERFVKHFVKKSEDYKLLEGKHNLMTTQEVVQYYTDGTYINTFKSISEAAEKTKFSCGSIKAVLNGKEPSIGGYVWKYSGNVYQTHLNRTIVEKHISNVSLPNWIHKVDKFFTFFNETIKKVKNRVKSFFDHFQYTSVLAEETTLNS